MIICGLDLSGPSNTADTILTVFAESDAELRLESVHEGATDSKIIEVIQEISAKNRVVIGIDAPLSYNAGGGDRPGDSSLRTEIVKKNLRPGTVMPPTLTRMVYLTLRGVVVARSLEQMCGDKVKIVEVHPSAFMVLRGAQASHIREFRKNKLSRTYIGQWLTQEGLNGLDLFRDPSDHILAACACALAAWKWQTGKSVWIKKAIPPHHPYDFAC